MGFGGCGTNNGWVLIIIILILLFCFFDSDDCTETCY